MSGVAIGAGALAVNGASFAIGAGAEASGVGDSEVAASNLRVRGQDGGATTLELADATGVPHMLEVNEVGQIFPALAEIALDVQVYDTPGDYVWTKPAGAKLCWLMIVAGGSAGQAGSSYLSPGASLDDPLLRSYGGDGGGMLVTMVPASMFNPTEVARVGAGATGVVSAAATGDLEAEWFIGQNDPTDVTGGMSDFGEGSYGLTVEPGFPPYPMYPGGSTTEPLNDMPAAIIALAAGAFKYVRSPAVPVAGGMGGMWPGEDGVPNGGDTIHATGGIPEVTAPYSGGDGSPADLFGTVPSAGGGGGGAGQIVGPGFYTHTTGGNGGNGGFPGGGGGAGGSSLNPSGGPYKAGGNGGNGASGVVVVITI